MATFNLKDTTAIYYTIADFKSGEIIAENLTLKETQKYMVKHDLRAHLINNMLWDEVVLFVRAKDDNEHLGEYAKTYATINRTTMLKRRTREHLERYTDALDSYSDTIADAEAYLSELNSIDNGW